MKKAILAIMLLNTSIATSDPMTETTIRQTYLIPPMSAVMEKRYIAKIQQQHTSNRINTTSELKIYRPLPSPTTQERNNDFLPGVNRYTVRREINNQYLRIPGEAVHAFNGKARSKINDEIHKSIGKIFD